MGRLVWLTWLWLVVGVACVAGGNGKDGSAEGGDAGDPVSGRCTGDAECESGAPSCKQGRCEEGTCRLVNVPAGVGCEGVETTACEEARCNGAGQCVATPVQDGQPCGLQGRCTVWVCRSRACVEEVALACDDQNVCTLDACVEGTGCVHTPQEAVCDACGAVACCTSTCSGGVCAATFFSPVCDNVCDGPCDEEACPDDCLPPLCDGGCPRGFLCVALPGDTSPVEYGCVPEVESDCDDDEDEDLDTWTDCQDPDCAADPACWEEVCDNQDDDDQDELADCDDPDCQAEPHCVLPAETCDNETDDDRDDLTDCDDPDCALEPLCVDPAVEICDNESEDDGDGAVDCEDSDCAGQGPCIQEANPGDVVISEIMPSPTAVPGEVGQWIELVNVTDGDLDIRGWVLHDLDPVNPRWHVIRGVAPVVVPAGGILVLGALADRSRNGDVPVDYPWSSYSLDHDADEVVLEARGEPVDTVRYAGPAWPVGPGRSLSLDPGHLTAQGNDDPQAWCPGAGAYNAEDRGTPGALNPPCP